MIVNKRLEIFILSTVSLAGLAILLYWLLYNPVADFAISLPGEDNRPPVDSTKTEEVNIGEKFIRFTNFQSHLTGEWNRFRGPDFDNISKENIRLINHWTDDPEILWEVELGEGHAAPVIYHGLVYLLDYHEIKKADVLRCFSLETGEEIWRRWYQVHIKRNHGMSRTIPAVTDDFLVSVGPRGHVMCVDPANGDFLWGLDLEKEFDAEIPFWYTGQCPLIDHGVVVIAPGGSSLLIGVDCKSGDILWETPNFNQWKMSHSSVMPMCFNGKKMYVYAAIGGICGISAEAENLGEMIWQTTDFAPSVVAPSPLILDNGKIFMTAGYGAGSALFKLEESDAGITVHVLDMFKPKEGLASEQQTPVYYKNRIYSILPKDAGGMRNQFVCVSPENVKTILWSSGKTERFGLGPYILADEKFYILDDDGTLSIVSVSKNSFELLDQRRIMEGQDAWGPIAIADGYLLMRDSKKMLCLDISVQ